MLFAEIGAQTGENNKMTGENKKLLESLVKSPSHYLSSCVLKFNEGEYKEAIKECDKAIGLDPNFAVAYCYRSSAKIRLGQHKAAMDDCDEAIKLDPNLAAAYCNRGSAKDALGLETAADDYKKAAELILEKENLTDKGLIKILLLSSKKSCRETAYAFFTNKNLLLQFIEKVSGLEDAVLTAIGKQESMLLSRCISFGSKCEFRVQNENDRVRVMPLYRLSEVRGRRIFGEIKPMLRDNQGSIIAVPKFTQDGGRTCWLPDLGIELKGIGTIHGSPHGNYGVRNGGEDPDPVGGMLKDKAIYEHLASVYLYIAGVDIPEPLGVAVPYNIKGPKGGTLALLARKPKTPLRGSDLLEIPREVKIAVAENLAKMHALGLVHYWYHDDNFNAAGQLLDLEGVRVAREHLLTFYDEQKNLSPSPTAFLATRNWKYARDREYQRLNAREIYFDVEERWSYELPLELRVMPKELTNAFAAVFSDGKVPLKTVQESMRDPRDIIGEYAKMRLNHSNAKVREIARMLYGRYETDAKETLKLAARFQKEIDYVKKNYC